MSPDHEYCAENGHAFPAWRHDEKRKLYFRICWNCLIEETAEDLRSKSDIAAELAHRDILIGDLKSRIETANQAILEFLHAQEKGPRWFTRGEDGMYSHVRLWLRKGLEATKPEDVT